MFKNYCKLLNSSRNSILNITSTKLMVYSMVCTEWTVLPIPHFTIDLFKVELQKRTIDV